MQTPLPRLAGPHQPGNLALAIAMLQHQRVLTIPPAAFSAAAETATWPARMQLLGDGPLTRLLPVGSEVWLDGGHNPAAGEAIAAALPGLHSGDGRGAAAMLAKTGIQPSPKWTVILGMLANKDPAGLLTPIAPMIERLIAVPTPGHEHHAPQSLAEIAGSLDIPASTARDVAAALRSIVESGAPVRVLILGSLYLAGEVLAANGETPD